MEHGLGQSAARSTIHFARVAEALGQAPVPPDGLAFGAVEVVGPDQKVQPFAGETQIFIFPGYRIRSVDALVTNFHLPESTLLMLVSAFSGKARVFAAYEHAVREQYRFFSYGDAMLLFPEPHP